MSYTVQARNFLNRAFYVLKHVILFQKVFFYLSDFNVKRKHFAFFPFFGFVKKENFSRIMGVSVRFSSFPPLNLHPVPPGDF